MSCDLTSCHAISVLYLVAAQAIYNFAPCLRGICSCVEFRDSLCTCKLRAAKYSERVGPTNHATTANFDLGLSGLVPLLHIRKLFFTTLEM